ncbi:MAG: hypothetical protein PHR91_00360 [Candidatus Omnitrophica bacterium]|nr:hypothetical protein [Candidatus Omnitrophota bacterium]
MKKLLLVLLVVTVVVGFSALRTQAATTTGAITVTAAIQAGTPDMDFKIYKMPGGQWSNINWDDDVSAMAFDKFSVTQVPGKSAQWTTVDHFVVFLYANGLGREYQITSTGAGTFANGGNTLPAGSFACIPVYAAEDGWDYDGDGVVDQLQGAMPSGASIGAKAMALSSNQQVYSSDPSGTSRIIQAQYAFPPYNSDGSNPYSGYAPIPANQVNGTYTGVTVTLNIVAI